MGMLRRRRRLFDFYAVYFDDEPRTSVTVRRRPFSVRRTARFELVAGDRSGPSYRLFETRRILPRRYGDTTYDREFDRRFFADGAVYGRTAAIMTAPLRAMLCALADEGEIAFANHRLSYRRAIGGEGDLEPTLERLMPVFLALTDPIYDDRAVAARIAQRFVAEPNANVRANLAWYPSDWRCPQDYPAFVAAVTRDASPLVRATFAGRQSNFHAVLEALRDPQADEETANYCAMQLYGQKCKDANLVEEAILLDKAADLYLIDLLQRLAVLRGKDALDVIRRSIETHKWSYAPRRAAALAIVKSLGSEVAGQVSLAGLEGGELSHTDRR